jgi:uncharacterized protein YabE (DUF348 family)
MIIILILGILALAGYAWANKTIILQVDGKEIQVQSYSRSVSDLLKLQGIILMPQDEVTPALSTKLRENMRVVVNHAVQLTVTVDGRTDQVFSCRRTVGEVLKEQKIPLVPEDLVEPAPGTPVKKGVKIKVVRVCVKEEIEEVPIPSLIRREADPHLANGLMRVIQAGKNGLEKQRWQITCHDGREVERRLVERNVVRAAVERVVRVGTLRQVSRGGYDVRFSRALDMVATAYTYTGRNTASGVPPRFGAVAVDPRVIPMGSRLYIEDYGYATALDRGSAIVGNRVDVFLETAAQASRWGVRRVKVYVLE